MNEIQVRSAPPMPMGQELQQMMELCNTLAKAPYYAKMGAAGILAICLTARELGLPLMRCLNGGMYPIDGKVSMSSNLINQMIINAGHHINILHLGDDYCEIEFVRSDRPANRAKFTYKFTAQDAEAAGLLKKDNWKYYRKSMLFSRALSGGGKIWMPDALNGVYAIGELPNDERIEEASFEEIQRQAPESIQAPPVLEVLEGGSIDCLQHELFAAPERQAYIDYVIDQSGWDRKRVLQWGLHNSEQFNKKFEAWQQMNATIEHEPVRVEI